MFPEDATFLDKKKSVWFLLILSRSLILFAKDRRITRLRCSSAGPTLHGRSMRDRTSTQETVRRPGTWRCDFRSESSFVEARIENSLCVFLCRPREADSLNSMHESRSKERLRGRMVSRICETA